MKTTTEPKTLSLTDDERAQMLHAARTSKRLYGAQSVESAAAWLKEKGQDANVHGDRVRERRMFDMASIWRYVSAEEAAR